ncbi:MAG: hypothetical protein GDYSWBUE_001201 [Candidatus Fervidibacterota bacterium]
MSALLALSCMMQSAVHLIAGMRMGRSIGNEITPMSDERIFAFDIIAARRVSEAANPNEMSIATSASVRMAFQLALFHPHIAAARARSSSDTDDVRMALCSHLEVKTENGSDARRSVDAVLLSSSLRKAIGMLVHDTNVTVSQNITE